MTDRRYISTRGGEAVGFADAALNGLAPDGGLYVPQVWPTVSEDVLAEWQTLPYRLLAFRVMKLFVGDALDDDTLGYTIANAYKNFSDNEVVRLRAFDDGRYMLELFHGPTLAFKDIALQWLGQVFSVLLQKQQQRAIVLGATSGDTGPAAIAACAALPNIHTVILYPHKGPSEIQRRQMTTTGAANVHALAVRGTFDDAQKIVKELLAEPAPHGARWLTINSINWARLLAQAVYYIYAALRCGGPEKSISFVVPTGNFGNIFAGFIAYKIGLPIAKLAAATNSNDAVARFLTTGMMAPHAVSASHSPSMDIQRPSNLERLLFEMLGRDDAALRSLITSENLSIAPRHLGWLRQFFTAASISNDDTLAMIQKIYTDHHYLVDPHTAVGLAAAQQLQHELPTPVITLGCAEHSKFPATMARALGIDPPLSEQVRHLLLRDEKEMVLDAHTAAVRQYLQGLS